MNWINDWFDWTRSEVSGYCVGLTNSNNLLILIKLSSLLNYILIIIIIFLDKWPLWIQNCKSVHATFYSHTIHCHSKHVCNTCSSNKEYLPNSTTGSGQRRVSCQKAVTVGRPARQPEIGEEADGPSLKRLSGATSWLFGAD